MYFLSHSSDKQYFSSQKIDENVVFLATTHYKSGLTRRELPCVVTRNETLSGYRNCINTTLNLYIHTILISLWKANSNEEWFWMKSMRALMITSGADQWLSLAECRSVIRAPLHWSEGRPCPDHWLAASLFFYQPTHLIAIFNDICP